MTHTVPRAERGIGALTIAVDGHWNSRMAGNVGSAPPRRPTTNAFDEDLLIVKLFSAEAAEARRGRSALTLCGHCASSASSALKRF